MKRNKLPYSHLYKTNLKEYRRLAAMDFRNRHPEKFKAKDFRKVVKHNLFKELPTDVIPIDNFPTYYARPNGEVWRDTRGKESAVKCGKERVLRLKPTYNAHTNYWSVQPYKKDGKKTAVLLHRVILKAFKGLPPVEEMECHHIDHNTSNNSADNLMWVTRQENVDFVPHQHRSGPRKTLETGRAFSNSKWSHLHPNVLELVNLGLRPVDISRKLDISYSLIYAIIASAKRRNT